MNHIQEKSRRIVVTGIGLTSALGNRNVTWQSLLARQSAIQLHQPFVSIPARPLALIDSEPIELTRLVDQVTQAAWVDATTVPIDAPIDPDLVDQHLGVCVGSSRSYQGVLEQYAAGERPLDDQWLRHLPHGPAVRIAQQLGAGGPLLAPMTACTTGISAIARGADLIREGWCDRVLAGAVEAPITPLTLAGFAQMGALAATGSYPFDRSREGLVLGEGAALLVLEAADLARSRGAKIYGEILGAGFSTDAYHLSAPDPTGRSARVAVHWALERSGWRPKQVDYIHAHGTATKLNDAQEAKLIQDLFPQQPPVSSTKGATGHTLGASSALGVAFCLLAIESGQLPPTVGLQDPEFAGFWLQTPIARHVDRTLCFAFGFGGQNAVLAVQRFED
ncbi:beta-ketoacyl-ACP synthase [Limnothrix sp. FACHB-1083]|uniref:beta-ketoacyl-ACP synthase n=1 Tax=unclassified Limnothrix TaxID=2632864 RepID=UPI0016803225|nr:MULTISPECIES: beta-ketoacyl-ACP synthase [unclassified Limnothrix]MBD2162536.1 beta-ketoacyl-ACP synthase [Limnothrix sp. FACHB-1083]MBD2193592.1 beta-ketoacyl-ACP synthase [Limnothrix sp. FACHB-1088]